MTTLTEADVEQAVLEWLSALGWQVAHGSDITWWTWESGIERKESPHDNQPAGV